MVRLPEIDEFSNHIFCDDYVDWFEVKVHDLIVDNVPHTVDNVEKNINFGPQRYCFTSTQKVVI